MNLKEITESEFDDLLFNSMEIISDQIANLNHEYNKYLRAYLAKERAVNSGEYNLKYTSDAKGNIKMIRKNKEVGFR